MEALVPNRLKPVPEAPAKPKIEQWVPPPVKPAPRVNVPERVGGIVNTEAQNRRGLLGLESQTPYRGPDAVSTLPVYSKEQLDRFAAERAKPRFKPPVDDFVSSGNLKTDNKSVFYRWATKLKGANELGRMELEDWSHLPVGKEAVDAYQKGDRSHPGFKQVEQLMNDLYEKEKAAGFSMPKKENYLRQFWKNPEQTDVTGQMRAVPQTPGFAKESVHESYLAGEASGDKIRRYENMNEIVAARIAEHKRALANKELYDYLVKTNQLAKTPGGAPTTIREASNWNFHGPDSANLSKYKDAVFQKGDWGKTADAFGKLKNVYLLGGVPGTALNIHGYNIARAEHSALGTKGLADFAQGIFRPSKDVETLQRLRPLIKRATEHGYSGNTENLNTSELTQALEKSKIGRGVNWLQGKSQKIFEDPLFKKRLPAAKALILEDNYNRLVKEGMSENDALKKAVQISSDFLGGVNRPLTKQTTKNIQQILFVAPDWAISRAGLAKRTAQSLLGKEDRVYAKAAARTAGRRLAAAAVVSGKGLQQLSNSPSSSSEIPLGRAEGGERDRERALQVYGTEAEHFRLPENMVAGLRKGDPSPILDLVKNRVSTPTKTIINLVQNQDDFGRKLVGKDSFGRPIPIKKGIENVLREISAPVTYQSMQAGMDWYAGKIGWEEFVAKSLELPLSYRNVSKENQFKK